MRHRIPLQRAPEFFADETIVKDIPIVGSVECMNELTKNYHLVYIGTRPAEYNERMNIVKEVKKKYEFYTGIGDCWGDNELHLELGAKSFIL